MGFLEQDEHLDNLSRSVGRQRDISLQINDELTVHTGLLSELEEEVDETHGRLGNARKKLASKSLLLALQWEASMEFEPRRRGGLATFRTRPLS